MTSDSQHGRLLRRLSLLRCWDRCGGLIIWNDDTLRQEGAGRWASIVELNALLHYLDIVRSPLLGAHQELRYWVVVVSLTVVGWLFAAFAMRQYRARVPYWV